MMMKAERNKEGKEKQATRGLNQSNRADALVWISTLFKRWSLSLTALSPLSRLPYWIFYSACLVLLYFLAYSCANPLSPIGGPRDQIPPSIVEEESTPNFQTNFEKQRIDLTFDEWVQVSDIFQQVVVSPPLVKPLDISLRKRTVRVAFDEDEELKDNVTYTINFGEAIKDLTEKNPAENLRFVFSTGDFLDSLMISGSIVDALTGKPKENIRVMLYENLSDTVVRTERPFYFAKTDKEGHFAIENVKEGTYRGFALEDSDLNYLFNQANEAIGFPDSFLVLKPDQEVDLTINLFIEDQTFKVQDVDSTTYGLLKVIFNQPLIPEVLAMAYDTIGQKVLYDIEKDTLRVWYDQIGKQNWSLYIQQDTLQSDTVRVKPGDVTAFKKTNKFVLKPGGTSKKFKPTLPLSLNFNHPIAQLDTALVKLYEDTFRIQVKPVFTFDTLAQKQLQVAYKWKEGKPYTLEILPGGLTDFYGLLNQDTILKDYTPDLYKNYGNLNLTLLDFDSTQQYIIELLGRGDVLEHRWIVKGSGSYQKVLQTLVPAKYSIRIITDYDANGRWNTGNYDLQRQPEPIYMRPIDDIRANWDVEATVRLGEKLPEPETTTTNPGATPNRSGGNTGRGGRNRGN
ncbi:MAG: Ig-like domain-containing protein [Saprospiraceae bacterium]